MDINLGKEGHEDCASILCVYSLAHPRAVTLSPYHPPQYSLNSLAYLVLGCPLAPLNKIMMCCTTKYPQMRAYYRSPVTNGCSNSVTHYSSPGPSASQSVGQGCVNFFGGVFNYCSEPFSNSAQISESHGRLPEQRVEVTSLCLLINPNASIVFNLFLSPSGRKCPNYPENSFPREEVLCHCIQC
jgi:hypothetical protein